MHGFSNANASAREIGLRPIELGGGLPRLKRAIAIAANFETIAPLAVGISPAALWTRGLVFAVLYFVAMIACVALTRFGSLLAPVWIPSAILAWALLMSPTREWPVLIGLAGAAHIIGGVLIGDQLKVELAYLAANIASPIVVAYLLQRRGDMLAFNDRDEVWRFLFACAVGAGVSTAIVSTIVGLNGDFAIRPAIIWFFSDGLSFVVFLPLFKIVSSNGWRALTAPNVRMRALIYVVILVTAHFVSAFLPASLYRIFLLLLMSLLVYVAFDAGLTAARAALSISAVLLLAVAILSPPPDRNMAMHEYLIAMQIYIAVTVATVLPIAATLAERQRLYETTSQALHDAQEAWGELIAAEAHYRLIADNASELILHAQSDGEILFASPACSILGLGRERETGGNLFSLSHVDDRASLRGEIDALVSAGVERPRGWRLRLRDMNDDWRMFDVSATLTSPEPSEFVAVLRQVHE